VPIAAKLLYTAPKAPLHIWATFKFASQVQDGARDVMTQKKQNPEEKNAGDNGGKSKKPYQKPAFRFERVFETMALACGKIRQTEAQCRFNRKSS
jgi:hypothetical protein